jgi:hypothetical protein
MLRAGSKLAVDRLRDADEDAAARALSHIRLTDVARVATEIELSEGQDRGAVTTGAIYQFWPTQAAFQADLMVHLLTEEPLPAEDRLAARTLELIAAGGPVEEMLAELAIMAYRIARTTEIYDLSLLFVPYSRLPRVGEALQTSYRDQATAARPIYHALLMAGSLKLREPWRLEDMMSAISALHDGYRIQEHSGAVDGGTPHGEQVLAEATVAILRAFTEPVSAPDPEARPDTEVGPSPEVGRTTGRRLGVVQPRK